MGAQAAGVLASGRAAGVPASGCSLVCRGWHAPACEYSARTVPALWQTVRDDSEEHAACGMGAYPSAQFDRPGGYSRHGLSGWAWGQGQRGSIAWRSSVHHAEPTQSAGPRFAVVIKVSQQWRVGEYLQGRAARASVPHGAHLLLRAACWISSRAAGDMCGKLSATLSKASSWYACSAASSSRQVSRHACAHTHGSENLRLGTCCARSCVRVLICICSTDRRTVSCLRAPRGMLRWRCDSVISALLCVLRHPNLFEVHHTSTHLMSGFISSTANHWRARLITSRALPDVAWTAHARRGRVLSTEWNPSGRPEHDVN